LDRNEPATSDWSSTTSIKFEVLAMLNKHLCFSCIVFFLS
jgi:hypothetical protein